MEQEKEGGEEEEKTYQFHSSSSPWSLREEEFRQRPPWGVVRGAPMGWEWG